jgi:hypothetical protein
MGNKFRPLLPIWVVFIVSGVFIVAARGQLAAAKFDYRVLLVGDILLFGVTAISFYLYIKALGNSSPHAFVRMMYGSLLVKMIVCLVAVFVYASIAGRLVNRNGILGCFGLYIVYTYLEVRILMLLSKKSPKNV